MREIRQPRAVLFDLDGTLLDTAPDLAFACNTAALEAELEPQPLDALKPLISGGAAAMLDYTLTQNRRQADFERLLERMLDLYEENIAVRTRFFEGMESVLDELERRGLRWGIVTNKIARFTLPLLSKLDLLERPGCVISGDTLAEKKPHPAPMLEACRRIGNSPEECVYVGDARRDVEAGKNAGMTTLAALYGYVGADDPAHTWGADGMLSDPCDLLNWLDARSL
ncbi:MAG: phosphoglycolate phosphatase [Proteobacteria bacterium]|nr:phosphoglycolate phosphatase [Pseudomonadota bacterium]